MNENRHQTPVTKVGPVEGDRPGQEVGATAGTTTTARVPRARRTNPRVGFASAYAPVGRRKRWAAAARCPRCGSTSLHRAPALAALNGRITSGSCNHWYRIVIKRTYRGAVKLPDAA